MFSALLLTACGDAEAGPAEITVEVPSATASPTPTNEPRPLTSPRWTRTTPTPTPEAPEPTPPPAPVFSPTSGVIALGTTSHAAPSTDAAVVQWLAPGTWVDLVGAEYGENWTIGNQDWVPVAHDWEWVWYRLGDGSYVYRSFVLLAEDGPPAAGASAAGERYVVVDIAQQMAWAMEGDTPVRSMPVTTGKAGFETPVGEFRVQFRVENERMTSAGAGFGPDEFYDVHRVLYTQYFAAGGYALHLNYWQPEEVFGGYPTSHGCIGLRLPDAQYLWLFGGSGMRVIIRESGGATPAPAPTPAPTPSATPSPTPTPTPSTTPTPTATPTTSPTPTVTPTGTPTETPTVAPTSTPEGAPTETATETP